VGPRDYLVTFRALPETQDWIAAIVVPRDFYLGKLVAMRNRLLAISLGIMAVLVLGGGLILREVKAAQARIVRESRKMNAFDFTPASTDAPFRDVSIVLEGLEQAKTAMRAMGKYVPIDLVRRLYQGRSEPALGGEEHELTLMFTDIKDFTTLSEEMAPGDLAAKLGRYLEVMARVIQQETGGTIDKYIGDAIMTFWNAPEPVAGHAQRGCLAALRCCEASTALFRSPEWEGHPPFETRFGLHCDTALVGHFGAPDRMNYTAIGDAVNLASRLEGLNKYYGTSIIASERIVKSAGNEFVFRLLDWVAVKGKKEGVRIYELRGLADGATSQAPALATYEKAFAAYLARNFFGAVELLAAHPEDPPSVRLLKRCREYLDDPPPPEWSGIYIARAK
jgi:adenylate cyclase